MGVKLLERQPIERDTPLQLRSIPPIPSGILIPLGCLPMGRDQPENAARVMARGAGVRLSPKAPVQQVLAETRFREAAQRLARRIAEEVEQCRAVDLLEEVAAPPPRETGESGAKSITA